MKLDICETLSDGDRDRILAFLGAQASAAVHQYPAWTRLNAPTGKQRYLHFIAEREGQIVSAGLMRLRKLVAGWTLAAIQRGPVTPTPRDLAAVLPALEQVAHRHGALALSVNPHWTDASGDEARGVLEALSYAVVDRKLQNFPTATAMIDLTQPEEALLARMSQTGRRHLRKAAKLGVTTRPMASSDEAAQANAIMLRMAAETDLILDSQHDFVAHFDHLQANPQMGSIRVTEVDGRMFGAAASHYEGPRGYGLLVATAPDVNVPRGNMLVWDEILAARTAGCTSFDMVGYPDPEFETDDGAKARGAFKRSFGPEIVKILPIMTKPLRPFAHGAVTWARAVLRGSKHRTKSSWTRFNGGER